MHATATGVSNPEDGPRLVVSVVSHGQGRLIQGLLSDILGRWDHTGLRLVLTQNLSEPVPPVLDELPFPAWVTRNPYPRGFAANHNAAFQVFDSDVFCVVNPDIRCPDNPMPALLNALAEPDIGLAAPRVISARGELEDSARRCITPGRILRRTAGLMRGPDYAIAADPVYPDWVAGMFMALRSQVFAQLGGFDEHYRLYCEDADLCMRLWSSGYGVVLTPAASVVHDARRASHRELRYLRWHVASLLRFFVRYPFYRPVRAAPEETGVPCRHL